MFYIRIVLYLQKNYEDSTKSSHTLRTEFFLLVLLQLLNQYPYTTVSQCPYFIQSSLVFTCPFFLF